MKKLLGLLLAGFLMVGCAMSEPVIKPGEKPGKVVCHFRGLEIVRYAVYQNEEGELHGLYAVVNGDMDEFSKGQEIGVALGSLEFLMAKHVDVDTWLVEYHLFTPYGHMVAPLGLMNIKAAISVFDGKITEADAEKMLGMVMTKYARGTVFCPMRDEYDDFHYLMQIMYGYALREYDEHQRP